MILNITNSQLNYIFEFLQRKVKILNIVAIKSFDIHLELINWIQLLSQFVICLWRKAQIHFNNNLKTLFTGWCLSVTGCINSGARRYFSMDRIFKFLFLYICLKNVFNLWLTFKNLLFCIPNSILFVLQRHFHSKLDELCSSYFEFKHEGHLNTSRWRNSSEVKVDFTKSIFSVSFNFS